MKVVFKKFGAKVFLAYALFILFISISFTAFYIQHQSGFLTDALIKEGKLLTGILAYNSRIGVFSENAKLLQDSIVGVFQHDYVLAASVFNFKGDLLKYREKIDYRSDFNSVDNKTLVKPEVFEKIKSSNSVFYLEQKDHFEFWSPVLSGSSYMVGESILLEKASGRWENLPIGFVTVKLDRRQLNEQIRDLLVKNFLIMILFLLIGSGLCYFAAHSITKPLNRLTAGVNAFGRAGVAQKVSIETQDEIGKLAEAFNNLFDSLVKRENELKVSEAISRSLSSQLLDAQEKERKRVSRELHDELGQALALLKHRIRSIQKKLLSEQTELSEVCDNTSLYIDEIIENVRRLSRDLRPSILEDLGLSAALGWLFDNFRKQQNIETSIKMENIDSLFSQEAQSNLYRIFQEILTNISKHAQASHVHFEVKHEDNMVTFQVLDNGIGFDVKGAVTKALAERGMGLATMQERAHMLGVQLDIRSRAGKGTTTTLRIPLKKEVQ